MPHQSIAAVVLLGALAAQAPQTLVVPAAYQATGSISFVWVPGASEDLRHQTLVGASQMAPLVGHAITGFDFRRTIANEAFAGGAAQMTVQLSTSPRTPLTASKVYAENVGLDAVQVFQGMVTIPSSPPELGPTVAWSAANVIHVAFAQPFVYQGGTLCIDITGTTVAGQNVGWWMADASYDPEVGSVADLGPGCGPHANANGQWSWVDEHSLLAGSTATMRANGDEGNFVVAVIGAPGPAVPLSLVGLGQPGCNAYLSSILMLHVRQFQSLGDVRLAHRGGRAFLDLPIPSDPWVLGVQAVTQWLDLVSLHSSNAVLWTIAPQMPTREMTLVEGAATDLQGHVSPFAHVLRFDYQ